MSESYLYYAIAPIDALHLTCDFAIYSAAIYGCPPSYTPTPVGVHKKYREPYEYLGAIPLSNYPRFREVTVMDDLTLQEISKVPSRRMKDCTCVAFEMEFDKPDYALTHNTDFDNALLQDLLARGDQILDVLRLYLFRPGKQESIGKVGAIGGGIYGVWLGTVGGESAKFIARKMSLHQLVQDPVEVSFADVGQIYNDDTFRELCSAACMDPRKHLVLKRVFDGLRAFRESRELQTWEARFRQLGALAETLAKRDESERLQGKKLRNRIAHIAEGGWYTDLDNESDTILPKVSPGGSLKCLGWDSKDEIVAIVKTYGTMSEIPWLIPLLRSLHLAEILNEIL